MTRSAASRAGNRPVRYRIVVRGELGPSAAKPMEGLSVRCADGFSVISGEIIDQPQLYGVLDWLAGLGIEIVSLSSVDDSGQTGDMGV